MQPLLRVSATTTDVRTDHHRVLAMPTMPATMSTARPTASSGSSVLSISMLLDKPSCKIGRFERAQVKKNRKLKDSKRMKREVSFFQLEKHVLFRLDEKDAFKDCILIFPFLSI